MGESFLDWVKKNQQEVPEDKYKFMQNEIAKYNHLSDDEFCKQAYLDVMNNPAYPASIKEQIRKANPRELMDLVLQVRRTVKN